MKKSFSLFDVAIALALGSVAVVGYKYSPLYGPPANLALQPPSGCDLNVQSCSVPLPDGGRIELSITPRPLPVVKPLRVTALIEGLAPDTVELDLAGKEMNMGFNRVTLTRSGDGRYEGETMIPVCVTGRMVWRATLMIADDRHRIAAPFDFEAPI